MNIISIEILPITAYENLGISLRVFTAVDLADVIFINVLLGTGSHTSAVYNQQRIGKIGIYLTIDQRHDALQPIKRFSSDVRVQFQQVYHSAAVAVTLLHHHNIYIR